MEKASLRHSALLRWLVLVLISALLFSTYWFYDFFSGIKGLMTAELGISSEEYGRILAATTFANMLGMILVGGLILDRWGIRVAGLVFGSLAFVGALVTAFALMGWLGSSKDAMVWGVMGGRVLFGIGMEISCVVITRTIVKWFKGYEMALAMAVNVGFGRLGTALGMAVSPDLAGGTVAPAVNFAVVLIGISLILFVLYLFFDVRLDRQEGSSTGGDAEDERFRMADFLQLLTNRSFIYITLLCVAFYAAVFPLLQYTPDLLVNKFGFSYEMQGGDEFLLWGSASLGTTFIFVILFVFGLLFSLWPPALNTFQAKTGAYLLLFLLFGTYVYVLQDVFAAWLQNGPKTGSLIPMGTILFTPVFGSYVDRKGKAATLMMLASVLLIFATLSLSVFNNVYLGYAGLFSLGIAFSLVPAAMWPAVARIVEEKRLGTAYGTMFTVQNWGLGLFLWGIGALLDRVNRDRLEAIGAGEAVYDYTWPVFVLVGIGVISVYLAWQLKRADKAQGYGLENPEPRI